MLSFSTYSTTQNRKIIKSHNVVSNTIYTIFLGVISWTKLPIQDCQVSMTRITCIAMLWMHKRHSHCFLKCSVQLHNIEETYLSTLCFLQGSLYNSISCKFGLFLYSQFLVLLNLEKRWYIAIYTRKQKGATNFDSCSRNTLVIMKLTSSTKIFIYLFIY